MNQQEFFLDYVARNYDALTEKFKKYCSNQRYTWNEDIFSDTILKVHDIIGKKGLEDLTDQGMDNYIFMSFKNNIKRDKVYYRNRQRKEIPDLTQQYDDYYNQTNDPVTTKILKDLKEDFSVLYILRKVEDNFPSDYSYCFKIKFLYKLTYKELQEKCNHVGIKNTRQKVLDVLRWTKENITKDEVNKAFEEFRREIF